MQPKDAGAGGGATISREDKVKHILEEILDKLPEEFNIAEIMAKVEERTPYIIVAFQECERMNMLVREMKRTLKELELGLKVGYKFCKKINITGILKLKIQVLCKLTERVVVIVLTLIFKFGKISCL